MRQFAEAELTVQTNLLWDYKGKGKGKDEDLRDLGD